MATKAQERRDRARERRLKIREKKREEAKLKEMKKNNKLLGTLVNIHK